MCTGKPGRCIGPCVWWCLPYCWVRKRTRDTPRCAWTRSPFWGAREVQHWRGLVTDEGLLCAGLGLRSWGHQEKQDTVLALEKSRCVCVQERGHGLCLGWASLCRDLVELGWTFCYQISNTHRVCDKVNIWSFSLVLTHSS